MQQQQFTRRLRLNQQEYQIMLERIESRCGPAVNTGGRARVRYPFPVADIPLHVDHPKGGRSNLLVFGRNISRCGISILHGGFLHSGSKVEVILERNRGELLRVFGEVRHCRLVTGSCHELGLRFEREIEPVEIVGSKSGEPEIVQTSPSELPMAVGSVLVVESFAPDHLLLEYHLSLIGLTVAIAETPGAAIDAVKRERFDAVLYGLSLCNADGIRTLEAIRAAGCLAPILVLTGETDGTLLSSARAAGADVIMMKPYNIDLLLAQMRVFLGSCALSGPFYSNVETQPGMPNLIEQYVELVRRIGDQILRTLADHEWGELREYCRQLRGSGCSFGFQGLSIAAIEALNELEKDSTSDETRKTLGTLVMACRQLGVSRSTRSA